MKIECAVNKKTNSNIDIDLTKMSLDTIFSIPELFLEINEIFMN